MALWQASFHSFRRSPSAVRAFSSSKVGEQDFYGLWIDGKKVQATGGATFAVENPATLAPLATVASGSKADLDNAVESAHAAFEDGRWSEMAPRARCRVLFKAAELLRSRLGTFAEVESRQTGRCLREYKAQLGRVPEWLEYHGSYAASHGFEGRVPPIVDQVDHLNFVWRVPLGVCGLITPWNHPLLIATKKIAVALAAGNSIVVKPPREAPLTVLMLAELMQEAGLPDGVMQVVPGPGGTVGEALAQHELVEKLDFTGGTDTGFRISKAMAEAGKVKPFCAELGGNAPVLVFDDVRSVEEAVDGVAFAAFVASGQTCVSGKRILVQKGVSKEFISKLVAKAQALRVGDPLLADTDIGPVVSRPAFEDVKSLVDKSISEGAQVLCGGKRPDESRCALGSQGHFYEPTILTAVNTQNTAFVEEIFGPVISVTEFDTEEDGIALANRSKYGLGAAVWTSDVRKAHRVTRRLKSGVMWVNCHHRNDPSSPWGGFNQSGIGRENGPEAFEEYTTTKSVTIRMSDSRENWFGDASARYG